MKSEQVVQVFVEFFRERGHQLIQGSTLIPEQHDPVLFTTSGMHPLSRFLRGEPHPQGRRLVNVQRCLRTTDLEEVGDSTHLTVFEMLGSWSLGDYSHEQSLRWGFQLLQDGFGIPPERLHVTVFQGNSRSERDERSLRVWTELGIPVDLSEEDNWWPNHHSVGPCGPDSEIFYWTGPGEPQGTPTTDQSWVEIWNHVSMRYERGEDGSLTPLRSTNVDTGMGLERLLTVLQGKPSLFDTDLFEPWRRGLRGWGLEEESFRLVSDHLRSSIVVIGDGVRVGSTGRGYVLRRLIRRVLTRLWQGEPSRSFEELPEDVFGHTLEHFRLGVPGGEVRRLLLEEEQRFGRLLSRGRDLVSKQKLRSGRLSESDYEYLRDTHGLPRELVSLIEG